MRNRPLCSVCLMVFLIFSIGMTAGGSRFFRELVPPEMKKQAEKYDDIELTCVSGEGDDNKENGLLEDCITKQYDLVIVV